MNSICKSIDELDDFIAFVLLYAPNSFHARHNMDLQKAFTQMNASIDCCTAQIGNQQSVAKLKTLTAEALAAYMQSDQKKGAHLLQDMAALISECR